MTSPDEGTAKLKRVWREGWDGMGWEAVRWLNGDDRTNERTKGRMTVYNEARN